MASSAPYLLSTTTVSTLFRPDSRSKSTSTAPDFWNVRRRSRFAPVEQLMTPDTFRSKSSWRAASSLAESSSALQIRTVYPLALASSSMALTTAAKKEIPDIGNDDADGSGLLRAQRARRPVRGVTMAMNGGEDTLAGQGSNIFRATESARNRCDAQIELSGEIVECHKRKPPTSAVLRRWRARKLDIRCARTITGCKVLHCSPNGRSGQSGKGWQILREYVCFRRIKAPSRLGHRSEVYVSPNRTDRILRSPGSADARDLQEFRARLLC